MNRTELFPFEAPSRATPISAPSAPRRDSVRCVFNGVTANEFDPIVKAEDATDVALCRRVPAHQGRRPPDRRGGAAARRRTAGNVDAGRRRRGKALLLKAQVQRLGLARRSASSATSRRAMAFPRVRCWWFRPVAIPCPMSSSRPRRRAFRWWPPMSAASRRFPAPIRATRCSPPTSPPPWRTRSRSALENPAVTAGAGKIAARAHLPALLAEGDGRGRLDRLSRRVCQSLTVLYQRNCFFRFVP